MTTVDEGPFFVHTVGKKPYAIDMWDVYRTLPPARGRRTQLLYNPRKEGRIGDRASVIYRLEDWHDQLVLVEVRDD